jgi:hypothetical protein
MADLDRCPAATEQWYKHIDSDLITTVIFSPGFSRAGKNK